MINIELTPADLKLIVYALRNKAQRKRQSIRNLLKRKVKMVDEVGEKEFNHRVKLRENTAGNAEKIANELMKRLPICMQLELSTEK